MQRRKLEELNLMDDFLFNAMLTHPETGEKFTHTILKLLFNRDFKNLKVSAQKFYAGMNTDLRGARLDVCIEGDCVDIDGEDIPSVYDVDHFIPWSFVMNDELWNLMPMDSSLNSSKSNHLPKWNPFFKDFAYNQYILYGMIHENENIHKRFEACYRDNLHSIWAGQELYRKGNTEEEFYNILEKNMLPVYESVRRQGYEVWEC